MSLFTLSGIQDFDVKNFRWLKNLAKTFESMNQHCAVCQIQIWYQQNDVHEFQWVLSNEWPSQFSLVVVKMFHCAQIFFFFKSWIIKRLEMAKRGKNLSDKWPATRNGNKIRLQTVNGILSRNITVQYTVATMPTCITECYSRYGYPALFAFSGKFIWKSENAYLNAPFISIFFKYCFLFLIMWLKQNSKWNHKKMWEKISPKT